MINRRHNKINGAYKMWQPSKCLLRIIEYLNYNAIYYHLDITANDVRNLNINKGYDWTSIGCRAIGKDPKYLKTRN